MELASGVLRENVEIAIRCPAVALNFFVFIGSRAEDDGINFYETLAVKQLKPA
jgi:hypothetical protein